MRKKHIHRQTQTLHRAKRIVYNTTEMYLYNVHVSYCYTIYCVDKKKLSIITRIGVVQKSTQGYALLNAPHNKLKSIIKQSNNSRIRNVTSYSLPLMMSPIII